MAASLKLLPGSTVRWRGRRYLIVDYESLDAIIARQPGKRRLERIPVNEAAPDHASHIVSAWTPDLASVPEEAWQKAVKRFKILKPQHGQLGADVRSISRRPLVLWVSIPHWQIITESESIKEPRGRSRSQSYSQIALLHSHLFLHDQLTFADISGTDKIPSCRPTSGTSSPWSNNSWACWQTSAVNLRAERFLAGAKKAAAPDSRKS